MRKKLSLVAAGLLAGATMSVTGAAPAYACHYEVSTDDPVVNYACSVHPDPGPWVQHYYNVVTTTVHTVYCKVSPHC